MIGQWTWCTKKLFGYRVIQQGYSLLYCPGQVYHSKKVGPGLIPGKIV